MTVSLAETVAEVRRQFRDVKWTEETLKAWVKDAVRDYSIYFPLVAEESGAATTGTYEYAFGALVNGVIECEYPTGDDPPSYPEQHSHTQPGFFGDGISYYDVVIYPGESEAELWLSDPATGSSYNVKYLTEHTWTASGSDFNTDLPDQHRHILIQYVIWQCWREILTQERETEEPGRLNFLSERTIREREQYAAMIQMAVEGKQAESQVVSWEMDQYDRIY